MTANSLAAGELATIDIALASQAPIAWPNATHDRARIAKDAFADMTPATINPSR